MKKNKAFTLIEIMVAIAIVGILAATVLVSMSSFAAKARSSKALAQLSSAIPGMVSCWGNGNVVKDTVSGDKICRLSGMGGADIASYGLWPSLTGDLANYSYTASSFASSSGWYFYAQSDASHDNVRICCNDIMKACKIILLSDTCNGVSPSN
jgi:prepilin-type N-terminal cleavage/methylation domain-containing protein